MVATLLLGLALASCGGGGGGGTGVDSAGLKSGCTTTFTDSFNRPVTCAEMLALPGANLIELSATGDSAGVGGGAGGDGTAADGAPIVNATVRITDAAGKTVETKTDANGYFRVNLGGMKEPMVARIERSSNAWKSALVEVVKTSKDGRTAFYTINLTGLTDLVLAEVAKAAGIAGGSEAVAPSALTASRVSAAVSAVNQQIATQLQAAGLNPATFNPLTTAFKANETGYDQVLESVTVTKDSTGTTVTPTGTRAGANLYYFNFTDATSWSAYASKASDKQAVKDANGFTRYIDHRVRAASGKLAEWGGGREPRRNADLLFVDGQWIDCPINSESQSKRDEQGAGSTTARCGGYVRESTRTAQSIVGRNMFEVYEEIRAGSTGTASEDYTIAGAKDLLGSKTFGTGATLLTYDFKAYSKTPVAYEPGIGNKLRLYTAAMVAGNSSAADTTAACRSGGSSRYENPANYTLGFTLEELVARMKGAPCHFPQQYISKTTGDYVSASDPQALGSGDDYRDFGISTIPLGPELGGAGNAAPYTTFFSSNVRIRASFTGTGNGTVYYRCKIQNGTRPGSRNCEKISEGSYSIEILGDARIMRFANLPTDLDGTAWEQVYVERKGAVYYGYQDKPSSGALKSRQLNQHAANQLFQALGLTAYVIDPEAPVKLRLASYQGSYDVYPVSSTSALAAARVTVGADESLKCFDQNPTSLEYTDAATCKFGTVDPEKGVFELVDDQGTLTVNLNFRTGLGEAFRSGVKAANLFRR